MLTARGQLKFRRAWLRWGVASARKVRYFLVEREGLVFDSRFVPAASGPARPRACLYLLLRGHWQVQGSREEAFDGPVVLPLPEAFFEGANGQRPVTFRAHGERFAAIEIHVDACQLLVPESGLGSPVEIGQHAWALAAEALRAAREGDDASYADSLVALVDALVSQALLSKDVAELSKEPPPRTVLALWKGLRPLFERFQPAATIQEIVDDTGVAPRQLDRYVKEFIATFGSIVGEGWRQVSRHLRFRVAVVLLSADGASITDVARAIGYGSVDAMGRAFREWGLPAPSAIQASLRATAGTGTLSAGPIRGELGTQEQAGQLDRTHG